MIGMQYQVQLPADYDMEIIRERVRKNGTKTDGLADLLFKAYLISEKKENQFNSYSPLYVWKKTEGMTKFIFDGFYDNILQSFGWQHIEIGITQHVILKEDFYQSQYLTEEYVDIQPASSLQQVVFPAQPHPDSTGQVIIYNPDKWKYVCYTFFKTVPPQHFEKRYEILHLSTEN